jgi:hypothetical protein
MVLCSRSERLDSIFLQSFGGSDIDAPPAKADMEPIRARLEDLRHSIEVLHACSFFPSYAGFHNFLFPPREYNVCFRWAQQFGSMLDTRLDNWLQVMNECVVAHLFHF